MFNIITSLNSPTLLSCDIYMLHIDAKFTNAMMIDQESKFKNMTLVDSDHLDYVAKAILSARKVNKTLR